MPSATSQQPSGQNEPNASTCSAQSDASPTVSERKPQPSKFWPQSSSETESDSDGTDESTVEHEHSTGWSSQPITTEPSEEETEERALQTAQSRFAIALRNGTPFELTSRQFKTVTNALEESCMMNPPEGTIFERRVRFLALVGDYAGRLFNEIRREAKDQGFEFFPQTAGDLRKEMEEDLKKEDPKSRAGDKDNAALMSETEDLMPEGSSSDDDSMSTTDQVRKCIDYLNANYSEVRALDLDDSAVLLAVRLYEERNQAFHCQIGHPRIRDNKPMVTEISKDHQREIGNNRRRYFEAEEAGDELYIETIKRIMAFYPASTDIKRSTRE